MKKIKTSRDDFSTYIICYFGYSLWSVDFALLRGPTNIFSNCSHGLRSFLATKLSQIFLLAEHELRITADDDWTTNENKIELKFLRCANEKTREVGKWDRCTHTSRVLRKIFRDFSRDSRTTRAGSQHIHCWCYRQGLNALSEPEDFLINAFDFGHSWHRKATKIKLIQNLKNR